MRFFPSRWQPPANTKSEIRKQTEAFFNIKLIIMGHGIEDRAPVYIGDKQNVRVNLIEMLLGGERENVGEVPVNKG